MTLCYLVAGGNYQQRQAAIAACLDPLVTSAVIFEGVNPHHSGVDVADDFPPASTNLRIVTIAIGCPCCDGGMVMRVTLNRMLQRRPAQLFISLADATHLAHLQAYLTAPPYADLVTLAPVLDPDS